MIASSAMLWILVVEGVSPRRVTVPPEAVEVGSGPDVGIRFEHPTVSRRHARFEPREGGLWICDLGSSNGTRVNGRGVGGGALAGDGAGVELGSLRCRVEAGDPRDFEPAVALPGDAGPVASAAEREPAADPAGEAPASTLNVGSLRDFLLASMPTLVAALERHGPVAAPAGPESGPPSAETVAVVQAAGRSILEGFPCRTVEVRFVP
ncbi:MAG: FHA domain-containing protein, partial [Acidobacteriota bacterium]